MRTRLNIPIIQHLVYPLYMYLPYRFYRTGSTYCTGVPTVAMYRPYRTVSIVGTLRYTTARCYYSYFDRDGLGWQRCFTRHSQIIKILLRGNGMCCLYKNDLFQGNQRWFYFHTKYAWLMTLISFSCIRLTSPRTQICLLEIDRTVFIGSNHKTK